MKKALLIVGLGAMSFVWGSQDVTIQVINAVYEKSLTKELDEKVKKSGIAATKKMEDGRYIITLGTYKDEKSAKKDLEKVRTVVTKDAFVRLVNRSATAVAKNVKPTVKTVAVKKAGTAEKTVTAEKTNVAAKVHTAEPAKNPKTETAAAVAVSPAQETKVTVKEPEKKVEVKASAVTEHPDTKKPAVVAEGASCPINPKLSEVKTIPILASVVMVERNELRRQEIHDAIEYYKNSPYHRFEPVRLQP